MVNLAPWEVHGYVGDRVVWHKAGRFLLNEGENPTTEKGWPSLWLMLSVRGEPVEDFIPVAEAPLTYDRCRPSLTRILHELTSSSPAHLAEWVEAKDTGETDGTEQAPKARRRRSRGGNGTRPREPRLLLRVHA